MNTLQVGIVALGRRFAQVAPRIPVFFGAFSGVAGQLTPRLVGPPTFLLRLAGSERPKHLLAQDLSKKFLTWGGETA